MVDIEVDIVEREQARPSTAARAATWVGATMISLVLAPCIFVLVTWEILGKCHGLAFRALDGAFTRRRVDSEDDNEIPVIGIGYNLEELEKGYIRAQESAERRGDPISARHWEKMLAAVRERIQLRKKPE